MADHRLPVVARRDENGGIIRILIYENWFERLAPILRYFKEVSSVASIEAIPSKIAQDLEKPIELINSPSVRFGISG